MAVAAGDAGGEHLALLERTVIVDLIEHLAVGVVEPCAQSARRGGCRIASRPGSQSSETCRGGHGTGRRSRPPCATSAGGTLRTRDCRSSDRSARRHPVRSSKRTTSPLAGSSLLCERPPAFLRVCPGDVARSLAVAGLAADADLGPGGGEAIAWRVVILAHAGRVALGAHEVPVLVEPGPMQNVVVADLLIRDRGETSADRPAPLDGCPRRSTAPGAARPEIR